MQTQVLDPTAAKSAAARLVEASPLHRTWDDAAFDRCVGAAIDVGQYLLLLAEGRPVAFLSWAWLSPDKAEEYLADTHRFEPADFVYAGPGAQLWFLDLIAPYGHAMRICRLAQELVCPAARERGIPVCRMIRQRDPRRVGVFSTAPRPQLV